MQKKGMRSTLMAGIIFTVALMFLLGLAAVPARAASIIINEFLADPALGPAGDANNDGTRDSGDDEFIELVNMDDTSIDLSGWSISDGSSVRHEFPAGTVIDPFVPVVVFGGGTPSGSFGGAIVQIASSDYLSLNNGGDTITLSDGTDDQIVLSYGSEANDDQSLTLDPDATGSAYVRHASATGADGSPFSPGTMVDGTPFAQPVPIPAAGLLFGSGLVLLPVIRRSGRRK